MSSIFGFRGGPSYRAATSDALWQGALDQPMSAGSTYFDQTGGSFLESYGLGGLIRDLKTPDGAPLAAGRYERPEQFQARRDAFAAENKMLDEEAYKTSPYFRDEVPWDASMTEDKAAALATMNDAKRVREYFKEKRPFISFLGNLTGQALDPINYIPVFGPSVKAAAVARMGVVKGVAATAALDAAANTAIAGLVTRETRRSYGDDVSWQMMVSEIATAALLGTAFGTVGGVLERRAGIRADALRSQAEVKVNTLRATQEARIALNEAIGGLANDGEVRLSPNGVAPIERLSAEDVRPVVIPTTSDRADLFNNVDEPVRTVTRSLSDVIAKWDESEIKSGVNENAKMITLSKIVVPEGARDKGVGTTAMRQLTEYADASGKTIALTPSSDFGGSKKRLEQFYRGFDFVPNKGKNKDFSTRETLIREPKATVRTEPVAPTRPTTPNDSSLNRTASWVIRDKATGTPVMETFDATLVEKVNTAKYEAVPIGQYLGEINGQPRRPVDASPARPEPPPDGRAEAEAKVAKSENYKALADQYRVDPEAGTFPEEAELRQLAQAGRLSDEDMAVLDDADAAFQDGAAYGEALRSVANCLI